MPTSSAKANDACRTAQRNPGARWHRNDASADDVRGGLAFQRLRQPFFRPFLSAEFKIQSGDQLFAIGSCFARGIERALLARKMKVLSAAPEFDSFQTVNREVTGLGFTNKYNTYSIRNELEWALNPSVIFPEESIVDLPNGLCYDPHPNPTLLPADRAEALRRRSVLTMVNARVAACRVVIITLGLVEVWRDLDVGLCINTTPPAEALARCPGRYQFEVSNFSENLANLEETHSLLRRFGHPDTQIVVTVSPVPLLATFTEQDVVLANTYSKSLLRTVAQEWAAAHSNVHYFPSYEIVLNSARNAAWLEDLRHVQGELVNNIMDTFLGSYIA